MDHQKSAPMNHVKNGEAGQGLVDIVLILLLVLVFALIALVLVGPSLEDIFNSILGRLTR